MYSVIVIVYVNVIIYVIVIIFCIIYLTCSQKLCTIENKRFIVITFHTIDQNTVC